MITWEVCFHHEVSRCFSEVHSCSRVHHPLSFCAAASQLHCRVYQQNLVYLSLVKCYSKDEIHYKQLVLKH